MNKQTLSVDIVEENPSDLQTLKLLLDHLDNELVVTEYVDYEAALKGLAHYSPDLLIVDIGLQTGNGMEFIRKMRMTHESLHILVHTRRDEVLYAERALRVGAHAYLMKGCTSDLFKKVVEGIMADHLYVSPAIEDRIIRAVAGQDGDDLKNPDKALSNRELEIFIKIGEGHSSRAIAEQLSLSIKTIETHRAHIKRKLGTQTARDLLQRATEWVQRVHA